VFKALASTGSGNSYRLKGINLNIFISHSYTPFNTYDIIGHDAELMSHTIIIINKENSVALVCK
jgi:hypothetical protein